MRVIHVSVCFLLLTVAASSAWGKQRNVPSDYKTVAEAVKEADPGDHIVIAPGDYDIEDIWLKDRLRVSGAGMNVTTLRVPAGAEGFHIYGGKAWDVTIEDVSVVSRGFADTIWALVVVESGSHLTVAGVEFIGGRNSLSVTDASQVTLKNCALKDSQRSLLSIRSGSTAIVQGCEITGSQEHVGIQVSVASQLTISNSVIAENQQSGVFVLSGSHVEIERCIIADNTFHGLTAVGSSTNLNVEDCVVYRNRQTGVRSYDSAATTVSNSAIVSNAFWGFSRRASHGANGTLSHSYNVVWNNRRGFEKRGLPGLDNVLDDPLFISPENYIFALQPASPARGAGADGQDIGLYPEGHLLTTDFYVKGNDSAKSPTVVPRKTDEGSKPKGRKLALVIGVESYQDVDISNLKYAADDAEAVARFLEGKGYKVDKLIDGNATLKEIRKKLDLLSKAHPDDHVLFYFSGHGSDEVDRLRNDRGYLLPVGAEANSLASTGLPLFEIRTVAVTCEAERFVILLDACFSGGPKSVRSKRPGMKAPGAKDITGGIAYGPGQISLYSSRDNEPSFEADKYQHGYFTHYLITAWEKGLRSADEVYKFVFDGVAEDTKDEQHPRRDYDRTEGVAASY